ncbi:hypothetical protein CJ030_MR4G013729 [Morella rubra]|uniref:Uncharacterized protein n=1 Tax=Morella rubra TaxID=262757 RepID=A0A6A1WWR1_9ROSI|nr:hypothetical protein CJ030_MR4G013729 [Morella rubra]
MNLGHLMINHMKAATEKKKQGLPYGMFFTHMFHILDIDLGGEVRETPKASKEYNQKTLRLMGFTQNDEGFWIRKLMQPLKREVIGDRILMPTARMRKKIPSLELLPLPPELQMSLEREPFSPPPFPSLHMESSSRIPSSRSHAPQFESLEASFGDIKEEQKKLGQQLEKLSLDMKTGFDDIKQLFAAHDERFKYLTRM